MAEDDAEGHGDDDPDDEEAVEEGEAAEGRDVSGFGRVICEWSISTRESWREGGICGGIPSGCACCSRSALAGAGWPFGVPL